MAEKEMTQEIEKALQQVYDKHLSKAQAEWLKERLEQVDELERRVAKKAEEIQKLLDENRELTEVNDGLETRSSEVEAQAQRNLEVSKALEEREEKVRTRENLAEVRELEIKLESAEKVADSHHDFLATLTKAPVVRKTVHKD